MAYSAVAEADRFLELHPTFTNETDNPVEILQDLKSEHDDLVNEYNYLSSAHESLKEELAAKSEPSEALRNASAQIDELVAFVRKLHDERKISDVEWERARVISKRVPSHSAQSSANGAE